MLKEFREFAMKGNVVDLAVGVVIGAAFGAIVNSLVTDLVTPLIGLVTGGIDFSDRFVLLKAGTTPPPYPSLAVAKAAGAVTLNVGSFVTVVLNFALIALALFVVIKAMNRARRAEEAPVAVAPPLPSREAQLLGEIRDLLKTAR
jgi:large conductance mechanosensitive channel